MVMHFKVRQSYAKKSDSARKAQQIMPKNIYFDFFQSKTCCKT